MSAPFTQNSGHALDLRVRLKESLGARFLFGFSESAWLPYITTGVVLQKASVEYVQDQTGYNVPASKSKASWVLGTTVGMGVKKQLDSDWLFTSEYLHQSLENMSVTGSAAMHTYGLRYPETQVRFNTYSRILRVGFSRKF